MNGIHWTCFIIKDNRSYDCDSFGGDLDKFLLNHLPKPIIYHDYKILDIHFILCGSYCFSFFHRIEKMKDYDTKLKMCSDTIKANQCFWQQFFLI